MRKIILLFVILFCISCSKDKKEAEATVNSFFDALIKDNESDAIKIYPDFREFKSYYLSDSIRIIESKQGKDFYHVIVNNYYTPLAGKLTEKEIDFYLIRDTLNKYQIKDSYKLYDHSENKWELFALKTGCLEWSDTTDVKLARGLRKADDLWKHHFLDIRREISKHIYVDDYSWKKNITGSASGQGIIKNDSDLVLDNLDFKIYYGKGYETIQTDDGFVSGKITPSQSRSFTFYTSYVRKDVSSASVVLNLPDIVYQTFAGRMDWKGNEYEKFQESK